jgi:hypothetical protein
MNIIKVTRINDDGSVAFEALYGPEEARMVLEIGTNLLIAQGLQVIVEDGEEEQEFEEIEFGDDDEITPNRH